MIVATNSLQRLVRIRPTKLRADSTVLELERFHSIRSWSTLRSLVPYSQIVGLVNNPNQIFLEIGLAVKVDAFLRSNSSDRNVISAIRRAASKSKFVDQELVEPLRLLGEKLIQNRTGIQDYSQHFLPNYEKPLMAKQSPKTLLSQRQSQVLALVALGMNNNEIAKHLFITEKTVRNHVTVILNKLGVKNRTQAAIWVINRKFI